MHRNYNPDNIDYDNYNVQRGESSREHVHQPATVKETVREVELHKVQPVIHRDREQVEIRHVVQPIHESVVRPTVVETKHSNREAGVRHEAASAHTVARGHQGSPRDLHDSVTYVEGERRHQELPAVIEETVHKKVIEHVHPVVYKEVLRPHVYEETQHIYETVREEPRTTYEVREQHYDTDRPRNIVTEREYITEYTTDGHRPHKHHHHSHGHGHHGDHRHHDHGHGHGHKHSHKSKSRSRSRSPSPRRIETETVSRPTTHIQPILAHSLKHQGSSSIVYKDVKIAKVDSESGTCPCCSHLYQPKPLNPEVQPAHRSGGLRSLFHHNRENVA